MPKTAVIFSQKYWADIGTHVFPMEKYSLIADSLRKSSADSLFDWLLPEPATYDQLALVHSKSYLNSFFALRFDKYTRDSELPLTKELADAVVLMAGGTILAARSALSSGRGANIGGGFHHAMSDHAEGFCYINDLAVAIKVLLHEGKINKALVIDCDLHQGNGTAKIFQGDPNVYTFSIHQENLYPPKEKSTLDIGLPEFTNDDEYLELLDSAINKIFSCFSPDIVLYQGGADPYEGDQLGLLRITMEGLMARDKMVYEACAAREKPLAVTLGGGYAAVLADTIKIHTSTIDLLARVNFPFSKVH